MEVRCRTLKSGKNWSNLSNCVKNNCEIWKSFPKISTNTLRQTVNIKKRKIYWSAHSNLFRCYQNSTNQSITLLPNKLDSYCHSTFFMILISLPIDYRQKQCNPETSDSWWCPPSVLWNTQTILPEAVGCVCKLVQWTCVKYFLGSIDSSESEIHVSQLRWSTIYY